MLCRVFKHALNIRGMNENLLDSKYLYQFGVMMGLVCFMVILSRFLHPMSLMLAPSLGLPWPGPFCKLYSCNLRTVSYDKAQIAISSAPRVSCWCLYAGLYLHTTSLVDVHALSLPH